MGGMTLPTRKLGKNLQGSALGFGCMSLTPGFYGSDVDPVEAEKTLRKALDLGITVLNTADFYNGFSEKDSLYQNLALIGKVTKDYPKHQAVITMKWGPWIVPGKGFSPPDLSPAGCKKRVEDALEVLGVDYIDVLTYRLTGKEDDETLVNAAKGMKAVLDDGKVKAVGISEANVDQIKKVHEIVPISVIELEWSLFARDSEKDVIPLARKIGATILAYSPLGRGVLASKVNVANLPDDDFRKTHQPRFAGDALDSNQKLADKVADLAEKKGVTRGQLALAWVLAQGDDVIPIPGTKRVKYLEENVGALNVKLSADELQQIASLVPVDAVQGSRY